MLPIVPFLILLVLAIILVVVAARFRIPYTIALVALGFSIGLAAEYLGLGNLFKSVSPLLTPGLFFDLLLPPIVFEAALHVNFRLLRARASTILFLVFVGVVFTTFFAGFMISYLTALPLAAAFLLAAILSPTDPIAVVDLFRRLRVPEELSTIVESESILNDAVGIVMFVILLGIVENGSWSFVAVAGNFLLLSLGGIAIGVLVAGGVYLLHRRLSDPAVETALSVVAAYGSFLLATDLGASGIIATAIVGITVGSWVGPRAMASEVRQAVASFWKVIVYIANSVVFLVMGLLFALSSLGAYVEVIVVVFAILFVGRAIFVYAHRPIAAAWVGPQGRLPSTWYNVITLAGIRGAIPVVLALSLLTVPTGLPTGQLDTIIASVLGVAFVSIVVENIAADWYVTRHFVPNAPDPGSGSAS
ncbi:MAG TPA: cation:proton antiporter [Thermoplasmata archaeon]|nr:cation:proton antiporter [Thermoplasmata archaeon]